MKSFLEIRKNLSKPFDGFKKISIAILGDSATQFIVQSLKGYGYEYKIAFDIYEADYDQLEAEIFNPASALYKFAPTYILILHSPNKLYNRFTKQPQQQKNIFAKEYIQQVKNQLAAINEKHNCRIIYSNLFEIPDGLYGNYAKQLLLQHGFKPDRMWVVFNSLDHQQQLEIRHASQERERDAL